METKIRPIGNSLGVTLSKEALAILRVQEGDTVHLIETPTGLLLTPYDEDLALTMKAYERSSRKYRNALRALAK